MGDTKPLVWGEWEAHNAAGIGGGNRGALGWEEEGVWGAHRAPEIEGHGMVAHRKLVGGNGGM